MTSLRYSNDKTDIKDFVRSFKKAIPYPLVALAVLITYFVFPVIRYVSSVEFKSSAGPNNIISYFGESTLVVMPLIQFGMVCCGLLTSLVLFSFMFSKKSVNVYFSMGITRTRLFLNRILAGVISLLIGVGVPLIITLIINVVKFGSSKHIYEVFFYLTLSMFTSGLSGFAIGSLASTVSGSIIEAVITSVSIAFIPSCFYSAGVDAQQAFLKGFVRQSSYLRFSSVLSPVSFAIDLNKNRFNDDRNDMSPLEYLSAMLEGKSVPKELKVDFDVLAPVILWLVVSIALIGLGFLLMNRRKAENANSFGKFFVSSAINGTFVFSIFLYIAVSIGTNIYVYKNDNIFGIFYQNLSLILFISLICLFVIFFLAELIIRRKIKGALHTLPIVAFLISVTIFYSVYLSSEHFGTYNKLPSQDKIESVSFDYKDARQLFAYRAVNSNYDNVYSVNDYGYESKNADDIKLAIELFEAAKGEKYDKNSSDYDGGMDFVFKLKDGTVIKRSFDIYTKSVAMDINRKSYESNYYKGLLKALLIDEYKQPDDVDPELDGSYYIDDNSFLKGEFKIYDWYYVGPSLMFEDYDRFENVVVLPPIEDTEGLRKALYEDLIKLPYDKAYNNTSRPLGALMVSYDFVFYTDDNMISNWGSMELEEINKYWNNENSKKPETKHTAGKTTGGIYLYPEMTNTLKFLKDNGIEIVAPFEAKVKEVYFANEKISLKDATFVNLRELLNKDKNFEKYKYRFNWDTTENDYSYYTTDSGLDGLYSIYYLYTNNVIEDIDKEYKENVMTLFFDIYKQAGVELNKVTNAEKAQKIVENSVPFFKNISSDDGRYIYIVYDNGVITEQYLPAANIGVIK